MLVMKQGQVLNKIFETGIDDDILIIKVVVLERQAHDLAERFCNGTIDQDRYEYLKNHILTKLDQVLNFKEKNIPVFLNGDPRGYALKIDHEYVREHDLSIHRDWGGYGILAPEE